VYACVCGWASALLWADGTDSPLKWVESIFIHWNVIRRHCQRSGRPDSKESCECKMERGEM
jgi:hypothetical protein